MFMMIPIAVSLLAQTPQVNPACTLLTTAQVTSLIGAATATPVTTAVEGSTCLFRAGNKTITVLVVPAPTAEGATRAYDAKKKMATGETITGWPVPAYSGLLRPNVVIVGFLKSQTITEVKVRDAGQTTEALGAKLQAVMKEIAGRK